MTGKPQPKKGSNQFIWRKIIRKLLRGIQGYEESDVFDRDESILLTFGELETMISVVREDTVDSVRERYANMYNPRRKK